MFVCAVSAHAIPAWKGFVKYTQPDGTVITLQKRGDEFCHWLSDASGRVYEKASDGFWRPATSTSALAASKNAARERRRAANAVRSNAGSPVAIGQKRFLVILVEFSDLAFASETAQQDFHNLLNQPGYSANGATGSARDYYYDNSHGVFEPVFDVFGPIKLSKPKAYYGGNDSRGNDLRPEEAVVQGCEGLDEQIDFSLYDNDGNGDVDLVFMYYAGNGEADSDDEDSIWPHQWDIRAGGISLMLDGKQIGPYACSNENIGYGQLSGKMNGIGTACHEFGHAMGLPDFYDTDYTDNGEASAMMSFSTMDSGCYNNEGRTPPYFTVEERIMLGWLPEDTIKEFSASGTVSLPSVDENIAYKTPTDMEGEYFVYECRSKQGWDTYLPAFGLIVTHIDKSSRKVTINGSSYSAKTLWDDWTMTNAINANGSHPCCYIVPSGAQSNLRYNGRAANVPFPGSSRVTSYAADSWNGVVSDIALSEIDYAGNTVSFYVSVPTEELDYEVISNPGNGVYNAGDVFQLQLEASEPRPVASVAWFFDDEPVDGASVVLKAGAHTVEAVVTLIGGVVRTLTLEIEVK